MLGLATTLGGGRVAVVVSAQEELRRLELVEVEVVAMRDLDCQQTRLLRPLAGGRAFEVCSRLHLLRQYASSRISTQGIQRTSVAIAVLYIPVAIFWRPAALDPSRGLLCDRLRRAHQHTW